MRDYSFKRYTIFWMFIVVCSTIIGLIQGRDSTNQSLPNCQEDEFLYPSEDYEGPGENEAADYTCVHFDAILDLAEKAHNEFDPDNAIIFTWGTDDEENND